jgi:hypothetical protein
MPWTVVGGVGFAAEHALERRPELRAEDGVDDGVEGRVEVALGSIRRISFGRNLREKLVFGSKKMNKSEFRDSKCHVIFSELMQRIVNLFLLLLYFQTDIHRKKNRMRLLAAACLAAHVSQANHTQLISLFSRERERDLLGWLPQYKKGLLYFWSTNKRPNNKSSLQSVTCHSIHNLCPLL